MQFRRESAGERPFEPDTTTLSPSRPWGAPNRVVAHLDDVSLFCIAARRQASLRAPNTFPGWKIQVRSGFKQDEAYDQGSPATRRWRHGRRSELVARFRYVRRETDRQPGKVVQ